MKLPTLSVRGRLLVLSLGLVTVLGGANLLLGFMIKQNEIKQLDEQEQYRRFEIIQATDQAVAAFRHVGGELNSAKMARDTELESELTVKRTKALADIETQLKKLSSYDPGSAEILFKTVFEIPRFSDLAMDAYVARREDDANKYMHEMQQRAALVESTLNDASLRERARAEDIQVREQRRVESSIQLAVLIILTTGLVGIFLTFMVIRSIIRPLRVTTAAIRQVNAGRTEIDLPPVGHDEFGDMALALRQFRDQAENLHKLAYQDPLTGLGNRARLEECLQCSIDRCLKAKSQLGLLYLDMDKFRAVNDRWGHRAGDRYLCEAVARLLRFIPAEALLCRYAGDSFAVIVEDLASGQPGESRLREIANNVLRGLGEPFPFDGQLLNMSVSIGIAVYPADGKTVEQLISGADAAMYVAKQSGRNNLRFASAQVTGHFRRQLAVASDIRRGLDNHEFEAFYQPIIDVGRGIVVGAEALLRWRHPERGLLLPGKFIHVAEESGLINKLGEECLKSVHEQTRIWERADRKIRVAVNLSVRQLHEGKILEVLRELDRGSTASKRMIDFELTESALLDASEHNQDILNEINNLGYRLGLDDFGTGYSSFSYLQRLPIDKIKIDHQFVATMGTSRQSLAIVSAILALAKNLDLEVVAEGVETVEQSRQLHQMGSDLQQGFLFTRALPAPEFEEWAATFEQRQPRIAIDGEESLPLFSHG